MSTATHSTVSERKTYNKTFFKIHSTLLDSQRMFFLEATQLYFHIGRFAISVEKMAGLAPPHADGQMADERASEPLRNHSAVEV